MPCADDYRYALHPRYESPIVSQAAICPWKTGTAPKPQLLRQVEKTQSMLSSEDFKQPIAVTKKKETHMVLWFGCSVDCEPVPSTEWGTGKCLKRNHRDSFISLTEKQINTLCFLNTYQALRFRLKDNFHIRGAERIKTLMSDKIQLNVIVF